MDVKTRLPSFDELHQTAISEWPGVLRLPVRNAGDGLLVEGLTDLHEALSSQWVGHELEVLMRTLHWAICRAIHATFACESVVVMAKLRPPRERFEARLRRTLTAPNWDEADHRIVRDYFRDYSPADELTAAEAAPPGRERGRS
jgi:hypothetical protein